MITTPCSKPARRWLALLLCNLPVLSLWGQAVAPVDAPDASDNKRVPVITSNAPAKNPATTEDDFVEMSPFTVEASKTTGYAATRTMSGSRINTKLEDIASAISVVTREQMQDTASVDINDIFQYEANTEGTHQFTDIQFSSATGNSPNPTVVDNTANNPGGANRIRGMGAANVSMNGFETTGGVPLDTYNVFSVEISRGPNSNMFGLGGAAGSVNIVTNNYNLKKPEASARFVADNYGGFRMSGIFSVPVIRDVLAIGVAGLDEDKGFVRKPSSSDTKRLSAGFTFKPVIFKHLKTSITGYYENYNNTATLPNSITPRDYVTPWQQSGMVTWNPATQTFSRPLYKETYDSRPNITNRYSYTAVTGPVSYADISAASYRYTLTPGNPTTGAANYINIANINTDFTNKPTQWIDQGQIQMYQVSRVSTATNKAASPFSNFAGGPYYLQTSQVFNPQQSILWQPKGISDSSLYDWRHINVQSPNYTETGAQTWMATIEQEILKTKQQYLVIQGAYFKQNVDSHVQNYIGTSGGMSSSLMLDVNQYLLDGSANPYYMRPFMAGSALKNFWNFDDSETPRGTIFYKLDFTQNDGWSKWLGQHNFTLYGERRDRTYASLAYHDYIVANDPSLGYSWVSATNKTDSNTYQNLRYYMGDNQGFNIDYGPQRLQNPNGTYALRWYDPGRTSPTAAGKGWVNENVQIQNLFDASQLKRQIRNTEGFVWQGYLADNMIIPTFGYRKDKLTEWNGPSVMKTADGFPIVDSMFDFDRSDYTPAKTYVEGSTNTKGIVVKPFHWISWLSLHYNQSDSFKASSPVYNVYQELIPKPKGSGKDYGFSLTLFKGKLNITYNQYETREENSPTAGDTNNIGNRLFRVDFDTTRGASADPDDKERWNLEANAYRWVLASHGIQDKGSLTKDQKEAYRQEAWNKYIGLPFQYHQWFCLDDKKNLGDTNVATGRGREVEINYNPTAYFTIKASVVQQKAYDSGVSVSNSSWTDERLAAWQSIMIPADYKTWDGTQWVPYVNAGQSWWTSKATDANQSDSPETWFNKNLKSQMALINATSGQRKPQTAEYAVTLSTRYRLAGLHTDNFLKNIDVGGNAAWQSRKAIGYLAGSPGTDGIITTYNPDGIVYNQGRPVFDLWVRYNFRILENRVKAFVQVNGKNITENGRLIPVSVNPDGTARDFRIEDPRQIFVTTGFDF